ncbi:MAG: hypothetical protein WEB58_15435 [Planctomycetaceae bacterium]
MADKKTSRKNTKSTTKNIPIDQPADVPDVNFPDPTQHDRAKPVDETRKRDDGTAGSEGAGRDVGMGPDREIDTKRG